MDYDRKQLHKGIALILISAALSCTGQLVWKMVVSGGGNDLYLMLLGFVLYGFGGIAMIKAFGCGPLSVLHPMMSTGYILSLILGALVLHERVSLTRIAGVIVIIIGLVILSESPEAASSAAASDSVPAAATKTNGAAEPDCRTAPAETGKEDTQ